MPGIDSHTSDWLLALDIVTCAVAFYWAQSLLRKARPTEYFAIYDILDGERVRINTPTTWIRLLLPIVLGSFAGVVANYIERSPVAAGTVAMFLGGLLVVWPPLVEPGMRAQYSQSKRGALALLYALYVLSHASLGLAGAIVAVLALQVSESVTSESVSAAVGVIVLSAIGSLIKDAVLYGVRRYVRTQ